MPVQKMSLDCPPPPSECRESLCTQPAKLFASMPLKRVFLSLPQIPSRPHYFRLDPIVFPNFTNHESLCKDLFFIAYKELLSERS
jgi:hypothetical protein